jgi:hypothetical protein
MRLTMLLISLLIVAKAQAAETGIGRYQLERAGDGFVRLDRETGAVSFCAAGSDGTWRCSAMSGSAPPDGPVQPPIAERLDSIEQRLTRLEKQTATGLLPSDEELNRALDVFGKMLDRFKSFARDINEGDLSDPH